MKRCVLGIFVGGLGTRMGGAPKGLLPAPDTGEPIVVKLARLGRECGMEALLVGRRGAPEGARYRALLPGLRFVEDSGSHEAASVLFELVHHAQDSHAIAVACDMPYLTAELLQKLASHPRAPAILAPRNAEGYWEPFFARHDASEVRRLLVELPPSAPARRSYQALFDHLRAEQLPLSEAELAQLRDWDTPADVESKP